MVTSTESITEEARITSPFLTRAEWAIVRRTTVGTLKNEAKRKVGPRPYKIGRKVLYRASECMAYLESCRSK